MELNTKNKNINLVLKTRKIVDIKNTLKEKTFEEGFFKAQKENDLDALTKIIFVLAEDENGKRPFSSSDSVYDYLDEYRKENSNILISEIYKEIAKVINEEGFFNMKMTEEQLDERINGIMSSINMETIVKNIAEKTVAEVAKEEFKNSKT